LKAIVDFGIEYTNDLNVQLIGYLDSHCVRDPYDRKFTTRYPFNIGSRIVSWSSKKKPTISLSSTQSKYKALCSAIYEAIWIRHFLELVEKMK
jgi:hypothetical protein